MKNKILTLLFVSIFSTSVFAEICPHCADPQYQEDFKAAFITCLSEYAHSGQGATWNQYECEYLMSCQGPFVPQFLDPDTKTPVVGRRTDCPIPQEKTNHLRSVFLR
jgi:hypothetical protein